MSRNNRRRPFDGCHGRLEIERKKPQALRALKGIVHLVAGHVAAVAVFGRRGGIDHLQRVARTEARTTPPSTRRGVVEIAVFRGPVHEGALGVRAGALLRTVRVVVWAVRPLSGVSWWLWVVLGVQPGNGQQTGGHGDEQRERFHRDECGEVM